MRKTLRKDQELTVQVWARAIADTSWGRMHGVQATELIPFTSRETANLCCCTRPSVPRGKCDALGRQICARGAGRDEGSRPIFQNGDNSALCKKGMVFGSLGEVHDGCTNAIATTKSCERAPARLKIGCGSNVELYSTIVTCISAARCCPTVGSRPNAWLSPQPSFFLFWLSPPLLFSLGCGPSPLLLTLFCPLMVYIHKPCSVVVANEVGAQTQHSNSLFSLGG